MIFLEILKIIEKIAEHNYVQNISAFLPGSEVRNENVLLDEVRCNIFKRDFDDDDLLNTSRRRKSSNTINSSSTEDTDSWKDYLENKSLDISMFELESVIGKGAFGLVLMDRLKNDQSRKCY